MKRSVPASASKKITSDSYGGVSSVVCERVVSSASVCVCLYIVATRTQRVCAFFVNKRVDQV